MPDDLSQSTTGQIPTNLRLLVLLERIAAEGAPVSPSALSTALDLPKATIHRLLATAEDEGFLQRDLDGRSYGPGVRLRKLSANTLSSQRVRTERLLVMRPWPKKLARPAILQHQAATAWYIWTVSRPIGPYVSSCLLAPKCRSIVRPAARCICRPFAKTNCCASWKPCHLISKLQLQLLIPKSFWMKSQQPAHAAIPPTIKNSWKAWPPSPFPYATTNRDCSQPSRSMPQSKGTICPN